MGDISSLGEQHTLECCKSGLWQAESSCVYSYTHYIRVLWTLIGFVWGQCSNVYLSNCLQWHDFKTDGKSRAKAQFHHEGFCRKTNPKWRHIEISQSQHSSSSADQWEAAYVTCLVRGVTTTEKLPNNPTAWVNTGSRSSCSLAECSRRLKYWRGRSPGSYYSAISRATSEA